LAYLREALWSAKPMVYAAAQTAGPGRASLAEHWNWSADGRKTIPVAVYTNCDAAELVLNGRSLGEKAVADRLGALLGWGGAHQAGGGGGGGAGGGGGGA